MFLAGKLACAVLGVLTVMAATAVVSVLVLVVLVTAAPRMSAITCLRPDTPPFRLFRSTLVHLARPQQLGPYAELPHRVVPFSKNRQNSRKPGFGHVGVGDYKPLDGEVLGKHLESVRGLGA